jgi:hypothetical protein
MQANPVLHKPSKAGLIERIETWFYRREQRALERYLATSADASQLETRMRNLDRFARSDY